MFTAEFEKTAISEKFIRARLSRKNLKRATEIGGRKHSEAVALTENFINKIVNNVPLSKSDIAWRERAMKKSDIKRKHAGLIWSALHNKTKPFWRKKT